MSYTSIHIDYNEGNLCEEISFSEPGEQEYTLGDIIVLSDSRLSRDRRLVIQNVNYTEDREGGLSTTVSGFSEEYKYTRKSPDFDISLFTMTTNEKNTYETKNPNPDSEVFIKIGDSYGVGGWSMHSVVEKIVTEWMGLNIQNTLPDFWISDFTISLGSTFFEAVTGLISEFDPFIILSGGVLYILERSGAGTLGAGEITLSGTTSRSVDKEYMPVPGCIKVEGQEGKYIRDKDPTASSVPYYGGGWTFTKDYSGKVIAPDDTTEVYSIVEVNRDISAHDSVLIHRTQSSRITAGETTSYIQTVLDYEYSISDILESSSEVCSAEIAGELRAYNKVNISYEHNLNWELIGQIVSKQELFVYDGSTYTRYDPRSVDVEDLEDSMLIVSESRTTRYSEIDSDTYGVETIIVSKVYNDEDAEWQTIYTFEHDIVEAGGQQRNTRGSPTKKTMMVYAGDCVLLPNLAVYDEPARIFNIPTPDWDSIEDCYVYLAALVSFRFQKVQVATQIIDPLPLMAINGLGSIIQTGIQGDNYVRGYSINIDAESGYTTALELEARYA